MARRESSLGYRTPELIKEIQDIKMHYKILFALAALVLVTVEANPVQRPLELVNFIALEEPCVRQGGMCRLIEDCDQGNLVQMRGVLCPKHRHLGVECCYL